MTPKQTLPRIFYRALSGRPLNGDPARYLHHGVGLTPWGRLPGWRRQLWRLGLPAAVAVALVAYRAAPDATKFVLLALALTAAGRLWRTGRGAWRTRRFRRAYLTPTVAALRPALGDAPIKLHVDAGLGQLVPRLARPMSPAEAATRTWYGQRVEPVVRWLPDRVQRALWALHRTMRPAARRLDVFRRPSTDAGPRIELTAAVPYLTAEQRQHIAAVISAKIPAGELIEAWDMVGRQSTATWTVRRRPPASVGYADLAARFERLAEWEYFIGLGVGSKAVTVSLHDDSPHIALSAGSGAGKSVLAELVAVQVLARGGRLVILDVKGSHRWAMGLPNVDYCTTPEQMHPALVRLGALADQRNADAFRMPEDWDPGPRVLVLAEELNATFSRLRDYWTAVRDKGDPKTSPAVTAFRNLLFMGRAAKINVLAVAQLLTANTTGGPESRENFGIRCLARYTTNAWRMLVPEAAMPRASRAQGRWQVVVGGVATETQVCYLPATEARLFVVKYAGVSPVAGTPLMGADQEMSPGHGHVGESATPADPLSETVTLRQAVARGITPWSYAAAKKRMQRARAKDSAAVPQPVGRDALADVYRVGDLIVWAETELGLAQRTGEAA